MNIERYIIVNQVKYKTNIPQEMSLASALSSILVSECMFSGFVPNGMPAWVLLNKRSIIDANMMFLYYRPIFFVTTIDYALSFRYFQILQNHIKQYGIYICRENAALLLFSVYSWLQNPSKKSFYKRALLMMKHYSHYFDQPNAIADVCLLMREQSQHNKYYKNNNAFLYKYMRRVT